MVRIAYILLCHRNPDEVIEVARQLTSAGDCVAIHCDARAPRKDYRRIRSALADAEGVTFVNRRIRCGWGGWSIVRASLLAIRAAVECFPDATHFYMLSGDCRPIKTAEYAHAFLQAEDTDYVESHEFFKSDWIRTGLKEERLSYRHFFNERRQKRLFYASLRLQRLFGLQRTAPPGLRIMIGSQWWCLRRHTIDAILAFCEQRPDVLRFFSTSWIPDETFFQTLACHLVPREQIRCRSLTFLLFSDYGMPVSFYNDHCDFLLAQNALFARKISPGATVLKTRLSALYTERGIAFDTSDEGHNQIRYLSGKGREGRRFAPRIWEGEGHPDSGQELLLVVCKKWHVAKRLLDSICGHVDLPAVRYPFDEAEAGLPDMGGIERGREKRARHRSAFVTLLFEGLRAQRLLLCIDPCRTEVLAELHHRSTRTRLLEIDCDIGADYLVGHARRAGLANAQMGAEALNRILPGIRNDLAREIEALAKIGFRHHVRLRQAATATENAVQLARFLSIPQETAQEILAAETLFAD